MSKVYMLGKKYGSFTILKELPERYNRNIKYLCLCVCGKELEISGHYLRSGAIKHCGCLTKWPLGKYTSDHPLYRTWNNMRDRCYNYNSHAYYRYGLRGITVCARWHNFEHFVSDIETLGPKPSNTHTLDRIKNNSSYCLANCRWATKQEQQRNTKQNKSVTYNNETKLICAWVDTIKQLTGFSVSTIRSRIKYGWSYDQIINTQIGGLR